MSSAILYVAIVAIWAGVLIPRWLRRDTSSVERADDEADTEATPTSAPAPSARETAPRSRSRDDAAPPASPASPAERPAARPGLAARPAPAARTAANRPVPPVPPVPSTRTTAPTAGAPDRRPKIPAAQERSAERKKVLAARRRLLGMLTVLALGSCTLAVTKMAAWWVMVPPFVMLTGYLGLLREASKADAERRELARPRAAQAAARRAAPPAASPAAPPAASPAATGTAPTTSPVPAAGAAAAAAPAAPVAPLAPEAEVIDISASLGEEFYDQYADAKLRAVGDLLIPRPRTAHAQRRSRPPERWAQIHSADGSIRT